MPFLHNLKENERPLMRLARVGWSILLLLILALFIAGIPARYETIRADTDWRSLFNLGLSSTAYANYIIAIDLVFVFIHFTISAIIFWRRKDDWMALFVSMALLANGSFVPLLVGFQNISLPPSVQLGLNLVIYISLVSSIWLLYLFPTGHFIPHPSMILATIWAVVCFPAVFFPDSPLSILRLPLWAQVLVLMTSSAAGIIAQVYRYERESNSTQRQQAKWGSIGLTAAAVGPFAYFLPFVILPASSQQVVPNILYQRMGASFFSASQITSLLDSLGFNLLAVVFPLSFAIAILRYRLWDIDLIIRRTLVYSMLTALLALIYLIGVTLFQALFSTLSGEQSGAAVVISTLTIAGLFNPVRVRLQDFIDRRFYRRKYDAELALAEFAAAARDETNLEALTNELVELAVQTMQPDSAILWIKRQDRN